MDILRLCGIVNKTLKNIVLFIKRRSVMYQDRLTGYLALKVLMNQENCHIPAAIKENYKALKRDQKIVGKKIDRIMSKYNTALRKLGEIEEELFQLRERQSDLNKQLKPIEDKWAEWFSHIPITPMA